MRCVLEELKSKIRLPRPVARQTSELMEYSLLIPCGFLASEQYQWHSK
ncbi:rCG47316, isoform CRA_b [Rattus norvegicus]|uniref:RCG47316, isoform CRA_b n=1 Tax=Rattus norvegicus TaxID=10116 RepID=A6HZS8_RAT|nr:rCG47316, isoform CRA_b [Rattus norvegicus]